MKFMEFYVVLNFKCYPGVFGKKCIRVIQKIEKIAKNLKKTKIIVAPQHLDLRDCSKIAKNVWIFSQHVDPIEECGAFTGSILPFFLKKIGVKGSIVNHSEKKLSIKKIEIAINVLKKYKLLSLVCVADFKELKKVMKFNPNFIAYEVPELIGTRIPISRARPKSVREFVKMVGNRAIPLCGAGISSPEDVKAALELGTKGVLIASAFAKSKYKIRFLKRILKITERE